MTPIEARALRRELKGDFSKGTRCTRKVIHRQMVSCSSGRISIKNKSQSRSEKAQGQLGCHSFGDWAVTFPGVPKNSYCYDQPAYVSLFCYMDDDGPRRLSPTYVLVLLNNPPVISLDTFPPISVRNCSGSVRGVNHVSLRPASASTKTCDSICTFLFTHPCLF